MAGPHSYGATLKNNKTENAAISFLLSSDHRFLPLSKEDRGHLLSLFGLERSFSRAFDLIYIREGASRNIKVLSMEDLILVELKTTQKKLSGNPAGFFFGATENEFQLARRLGDKYKFCFVSLHSESKTYKLLSLTELELMIRTKRTQYQINL
jgi:hypothetical protein